MRVVGSRLKAESGRRTGGTPLAFAGVLTLALSIGLQGPTHAEPPSPLAGSGYLLQAWSTEDGLPENSATAIAQTRDGYLWLGTWRGLVRYNADSFVVFNPGNTPQLPDAGIVNLHADKRDRLWVSTGAGLVVKDGTQWRPLGTNEGWAGNHVRTFAEGVNGDLLITTFDGHVLAAENDRLTELPPPPGEPGQGYLGAVDENSRWWVAQNRFVGYWDGQRWVEVHVPNPSLGRSAVACTAARGGGVWVLLAKELFKFRGGIQTHRSSFSQFKGGIWSMSEDSQTNLWICSYDSGLYQVTPGGELRHWTTTNGLGTSATRVIFEDREENLWIGSNGDGLKRLTRQRFFPLEGRLPGSRARSVAAARDGGVWIAVYDAGLFRQDERGIARVSVPGPGNQSVYGLSVLEDRAGRLWYGDQDSCWVRRGQDRFEKVPLEPATGANVTALFEDTKGRVWIATRGGAVVCDGDGFEPLGLEAGLPPGGIAGFGEDTFGGLWVAKSEGVYRRVTHQFAPVLDADGQPLPGVLCFQAEADGTLWMGTRTAGLIRWRKGELDRIGIELGLSDLEVRGFVEDAHGSFWMPSNHGVLRASLEQLHALADQGPSQLEIQLLDRHDGLPSPECSTAQPNCVRDTSGTLWFATQKGVAALDPDDFRIETEPPPVHIEQLTYRAPTTKSKAKANRGPGAAAGSEVRLQAPFQEPLRLPPGTYGLDIESAALSLTAPEKIRFGYNLEGGSREWRDAGRDRVVRFHQLPPGEYVFRVRAANHDGVWNQTGASLAFSVLPYFWQTGWFRLGTGLLLVALGATSVWSWAQRKTAQALERERMAGEMQRMRLQLWHTDRVAQTGVITGSLAHELNQPLTGILSTAQAGLRFMARGNPDPGEIHGILTNIVHDTKRAGAIINGLRAMLRQKETAREPMSLAETIHGVLALLHSELIAREVEHRLRLESDSWVLADKAQIQQVFLNLVMNALEAMHDHSAGQRRMELTLTRTDTGEALVSVRDSGPGIPPDQQHHIFKAFWTTKSQGMGIGLPISHSIIESHGGRMWCANHPDGGAVFYFSLPLERE